MLERYVYQKLSVRMAMSVYDFWGELFLKQRPRSVEKPTTICLVILSQIGDVIVSLPTIVAISKSFPEASISIIAGQITAPILQASFPSARVIAFDARWQATINQSLSASVNRLEIDNAKGELRQLLPEIGRELVVVFHPDLVVNQLVGQAKPAP